MTAPLISPDELSQLSDDVVILDARPAADYATAHLNGAQYASGLIFRGTT